MCNKKSLKATRINAVGVSFGTAAEFKQKQSNLVQITSVISFVILNGNFNPVTIAFLPAAPV